MRFIVPCVLSSLATIVSSTPVPDEDASSSSYTKRGGVQQEFGKGWYVYSNTGPFVTLSSGQTFVFQNDGNFVAYYGSDVLFDSGTAGHTCAPGNSECELIFQGDGNLVVYIDGVAKWNSGTQGIGSVLSFNNGDVIDIYSSTGERVYCADCTGGGCRKRDGNATVAGVDGELHERCVA